MKTVVRKIIVFILSEAILISALPQNIISADNFSDKSGNYTKDNLLLTDTAGDLICSININGQKEAEAIYSIDRLFVNCNDVDEGEAQYGAVSPDGSDVEITAGDSIYITGWIINTGTGSPLDKIVYSVDGGADIECEGGYRDRPDVAAVFGFNESAGIGAGFGFSNANQGGMMRLAGIENLAEGTYEITIKAIFEDGSVKVFDKTSNPGIFTLIVNAPANHAALVNKSFNTIWVDGTKICDVRDALEYCPITDPQESIGLRGWACIKNSTIAAMGYRIDDGEPITSTSYIQDRSDVQAALGVTADVANGFNVNPIDVSGLAAGDHTVTVVIKAIDGTYVDVVAVPIIIVRPVTTTKCTNAAWDNLWYDEIVLCNTKAYSWVVDHAGDLDYEEGTVSRIYFGGWAQLDHPLAGFGFIIDDGEVVSDPSFIQDRAAELEGAGFTGAQGYAISVTVDDLTVGEHTIKIAAIAENGDTVEIFKKKNNVEYPVAVTFTITGAPKPARLVTMAVNTIWADNNLICDVDDALEYCPIINAGKIGLRGWTQIENSTIEAFGYRIDDGEPVISTAYTENRADIQTELGVSADYANGFKISSIDLDTRFGDHTVTVVVKASDGTYIDVVEVPVYYRLDVDGDGELNLQDLIVLQRYLSGNYIIQGDIISKCDIYPDGIINNKDVIMISRYLGTGVIVYTIHTDAPVETDHIYVNIDEAIANPGEEIPVQIKLYDVADLSSMKIILKYDEGLSVVKESNGKAKVTFDIIPVGEDPYVYSYMINNPEEHTLLLNWMLNFGKVEGDCVYATVYFKVADNAEQGTFLPIDVYCDPDDLFDTNLNSVDAFIVNGGVEISSQKYDSAAKTAEYGSRNDNNETMLSYTKSNISSIQYYKQNNGSAIAAYYVDSENDRTVPILVSMDSASLDVHIVFGEHNSYYSNTAALEYKGKTYYYTGEGLGIHNDYHPQIDGHPLYKCSSGTAEEAALEILALADASGDLSYINPDAYTHTHNYMSTVTEPTCTEQGYTTYTCTICGYVYVDNYVDAMGHNWNDWQAHPDISTSKIRYCSACGESEKKENTDYWHCLNDAYYDSDDDYYVLTENKGSQTGAILLSYEETESFSIELDYYTGDKDGADGMAVTFYSQISDNTALNTNGGAYLGIPLGFRYAVELDTYYQQGGEPSCNHIALIESDTSNHIASDSLPESEDNKWHHLLISTENGTCHVYVDDAEKFSSSVDYSGYNNIAISAATGGATNFHAVKNINVVSLGESCEHEYVSVVYNPTCTTDGYSEHRCSLCGRTYRDEITSALGHFYEVTDSKSASCTKEGYASYFCSRCGETYTAVLPALGHDYTEETVDAQGHKVYRCSVCGYSYSNDTFTITWVVNGTDITEEYSYRDIPSYKGDFILNDENEQFSLITGFEPSISPVEKDATYYAVIENKKEFGGNCGKNGGNQVRWTLSADGVLTIAGTGMMESFNSASQTPWYSTRDHIKHVIVGGNVLSVSDYAFAGCGSLIDVYFENCIEVIGNNIFDECFDLQSVRLPAKLSSVSSKAFSGLDGVEFLFCDVSVTSIVIPDTAVSESKITVQWTVKNVGDVETGNTVWVDRIYLIPKDAFKPSDAIGTATVDNLISLNAGESYQNHCEIYLPAGYSGQLYAYVVTDWGSSVYEMNSEENNTERSAVCMVSLVPKPDLYLQNAEAAVYYETGTGMYSESLDTISKSQVTVRWTVINDGNKIPDGKTWTDAVSIVSSDGSEKHLLGRITVSSNLQNGTVYMTDEGYTAEMQVLIPEYLFGSWKLLVQSDYYGNIEEYVKDNNNAQIELNITLNPPADIVVTEVSAPISIISGQTIEIKWSDVNYGVMSVDGKAWTDRVYISSSSDFSTANLTLLAEKHNVREGVENIVTVTIPQKYNGIYYIYIVSDAYHTVFEYETYDNNIAIKELSVALCPLPDMIVENIIASDETLYADETFAITYTVKNNGPASVLPFSQTDGFYLIDSNGKRYDLNSQTKSFSYNTGEERQITTNITLPKSLPAGSYTFYVYTDSSNRLFEEDEGNNTASTHIEVLDGRYADLVISAFAMVLDGTSAVITYTVKNTGNKAALSWKDAVSINSKSNRYLLLSYDNKNSLQPGESYTVAKNVTVPENINAGVYEFIVYADYYETIEEMNERNNSANSSFFDPEYTYYHGSSDLSLIAEQAFSTVRSGEMLSVSYSVKNNSNYATKANSWRDSVLIVNDSGTVIASADSVHTGGLRANDTYTSSISIRLPDGISGNYTVKIVCDKGNTNGESNTENNIVTLDNALDVLFADYADLSVISVTLPDRIIAGQEFPISYIVKNSGTAASKARNDIIRYKAAGMIGFITLKAVSVNTVLETGKTDEHTVTVSLPTNIEGDCVIQVEANSARSFYEVYSNNILNETQIVQPCPTAEICASNVIIPASSTPGKTITVKWDVINLSELPVDADFSDNIYISADNRWDSNDILITQYNRRVRIGASSSVIDSIDVTLPEYEELSKLTEQVIGIVPNIKEGEYYIIVRTDARDQIREENEKNNICSSSNTLTVNMESITFDEIKSLSLDNNGEYYYRLNTVNSSASAGAISIAGLMNNATVEVYVKYGEVPSATSYDKKTSSLNNDLSYIPFSLNRQGNYYIYIRETGGASVENIIVSVKAENYGVRVVSPEIGGKGSVTVKLTGSLMEAGMEVYLQNDQRKIAAQKLYLIDSTTAYATFDTTYLPNGNYDIRAVSVYGESVLNNAFTVSDLPKGKLEVHVSLPDTIAANLTAAGQISWTNSGYTDIYAPILYLQSSGIEFKTTQSDSLTTEELLFAYNSMGISGILAHGEGGSMPLLIDPVGENGDTYTLNAYNYADFDFDFEFEPLTADSDAIEIISYNYGKLIGTTQKDYAETIALTASYLDQFKNTDYSIDYLAMAAALNANTTMLGDTITSVTDIESLQLSVSRSFMSGIEERHIKGAFGYGWTTGYETKAVRLQEDDLDGIIIKSPSGIMILLKEEGVYKEAVYGLDTATVDDADSVILTYRDGTVYRFDENGRLSSVVDANGNAVVLSWQDENLITLETSDGDRIDLEYTDGLITRAYSVTDEVTYEYNNGYLTSVTGKYGTVSYEYDTVSVGGKRGALTKITGITGVSVHYEYDELGRLISTYGDEDLEKTTYIYGRTNEVTVLDSLGNKSVISYNADGMISRTVGANGLVTGYDYDEFGRTSGITLYNERHYFYDYNAYGDTVSATDADGHSVYYGYDALGNLSSVTDKRGITTGYLRDAKGNLTAMVYGDGSTESYEYDAKGNLIALTDRAGRTTRYSYDGYSRIVRTDFYDGTYIAYTYDENGNTVMIDENGDITAMTYDEKDQMLSVTYPDGMKLLYDYDNYGRMLSVKDGGGDGTGYVYDRYGRTSAVTDQDGRILAVYEYNTDSSLYAMYNANGTYTRYTYNAGLIKSIYNYGADDGVQSFFEYTYDRFGSIVSMKTEEGVWKYEYDVTGQLSYVESPDGEKTRYTYDLSGNKTSVTVNGVTTLYEANRLDQTVKVGDMSLYYDANGNLIRTVEGDTVTEYEYDVYGKLIRISVSGTETAAYSYDAFGNRNSVTFDGTTTEYLNSPTGLGYAVAAYRSGEKTVYSWSNGLVASKTDDNSYFYSFNHLGSVIDVTDASGTVVNSYAYDVWGRLTEKTETVTNPFRYVGQHGIMDDDNGLWYVRARYVSQISETFTTVDPIGQYADLNVYRYAINDMVEFIDISGKDKTTLYGDISTIVSLHEADPIGLIPKPPAADLVFIGVDAAKLSLKLQDNFQDNWEKRKKLYYDENDIRELKKMDEEYYDHILNPGKRIIEWFRDFYKNYSLFTLIYEHHYRLIRHFSYVGIYCKNCKHICYYSSEVKERKILLYSKYYIVTSSGEEELSYLKFDAYTRLILYEMKNRNVIDKNSNNTTGRYTYFNRCIHCISPSRNPPATYNFGTIVASYDPNDIIGPNGYGDAHWVSSNDTLQYTIRFENEKELATAPVRLLTVTQELDAGIDPRSFRLNSFGFGENVFTVSNNTAFYQTRLDLTEKTGLYVDVSAGVDVTTGKVKYTFTAIDPQTGRMPDDPMVGFLPVNDDNGAGEGFISYTVKARPGIATGSVITANADIIFDYNDVIATPTVFNTVDADPPVSQITGVSEGEDGTVIITVACDDTDFGSGIAAYDLYVSVNSEPYKRVMSDILYSSVSFNVESGNVYRFYAAAKDNAGNVEAAKPDAIAEYAAGYVSAAPDAPVITAVKQVNGGAYITLQSPDNASIIYTLNGEEPVVENAEVYTDGLLIKPGMTLKVRTVRGALYSDTVSYYANIALSNGEIVLKTEAHKVSGISEKTTAQYILNLFNGTDSAVQLVSKDHEILNAYDYVGTSSVLTIDGVDYVIIVTGDINGDGKINLKDYALLKQYINNWDVGIELDAASVTGDSVIDFDDLELLRQYINGWDVVLE